MNLNISFFFFEIKFVFFYEKVVVASKKKLLFFNGIVFRREFLNLFGNFVVKVEDIKEKLKLYGGGGFIFCERGRFINFGRRVVNDYFEKFFVNVFVLRIILVLLKVKKRKVRCLV